MRDIAPMPNQVEYDFRQCDRRLKNANWRLAGAGHARRPGQASRLAATASGRARLADNQKVTMKSLLALLLASACFQAQSANLPPCDKAVRFTAAWFADPEVDNAKSAAELTKIGAGAGRSGTQLGHVVVE